MIKPLFLFIGIVIYNLASIALLEGEFLWFAFFLSSFVVSFLFFYFDSKAANERKK